MKTVITEFWREITYTIVNCAAKRCNEKVPAYTLGFCKKHWKMIPRDLQKTLWKANQHRSEVMWQVNFKTAVERIDKKENYGQQKFL